jgi:hypothetical protein
MNYNEQIPVEIQWGGEIRQMHWTPHYVAEVMFREEAQNWRHYYSHCLPPGSMDPKCAPSIPYRFLSSSGKLDYTINFPSSDSIRLVDDYITAMRMVDKPRA